jgi:hypothetical protein
MTRSRGQRVQSALGLLLLVLAWIGGVLSAVIWAGYAMFCVMWLHAPVGTVLLLTSALMALSIGAFACIGWLAAGMRRPETPAQSY